MLKENDDENPNEYWAELPTPIELNLQDYLNFVAYIVKRDSIITVARLEITKNAQEDLDNKLIHFGPMGDKIEKDIQELAKLDVSALKEKLTKDYLKQED